MTELFENSTCQIMQKCSQVLQKQPNIDQNQPKNTQMRSIKHKNKQILICTTNSTLSPLQEAQNNKIIQKMRGKYNKKKQIKQVLIRKTDLGENQMIFTKQQLQKLKQIDDEQMYRDILHQPTLNIVSQKAPENSLQNKKYFINSALDNSHQQIKKYLEWVNLNQVKTNKDKNKNKIINFQKRQNSSSATQLHSNKRYKFPNLNFSPKHNSSFGKDNHSQLTKVKSSYPLMKKNSVDNGFLNSINSTGADNKLSQAQKLNQIILKANNKIQKELNSSTNQNKYIYMTEERKQALFQCEILRKVKRQIGPKFYNNLLITYGTKQKPQKTEEDDLDGDKENNQNSNFLTKSNQGEKSTSKKGFNKNAYQNAKQKGCFFSKQRAGEIEAQRMILKNKNRLKQQRKRVIQKISC